MAWTDKYVSVSGSGAHDGSSAANEWTFTEALSSYAAGQRINVKTGTYSSSTTDRTFGTAGTTTSPVMWRGYNATPGDLDADPGTQRTPGTNMPLFTSTTGRYYVQGAYQSFSGISFTSGYTAAGTVLARGGHLNFHRCRFENSASNTAAAAVDVRTNPFVSFESCHMRRTATTSGYKVIDQDNTASHVAFVNCIVEGGNIGISLGDTIATQIVGCIIRGQSGNGILMPNASYIVIHGNTFYNITSDAIKWSSAAPSIAVISGNYFHTIGGFAINNASATNTQHVSIARNCYYNVSSGQLNGITNSEQSIAITDSADKFVSAGANDVTLISSSASYSYALLYEKDGPKSYIDIGAVRHQDAGGAGGARQVNVRGGADQ